MTPFWKLLILSGLALLLALFGLVGGVILANIPGILGWLWLTIFLLIWLSLVGGWAGSTFLYYRYLRQEEIVHLLAGAADAQQPLAPAVWAYLRDRPSGNLRILMWLAFLIVLCWPLYAAHWLGTVTPLLLFWPVAGYYWFWHRFFNFDRKVERLARHLEAGFSLAQSLRRVPGVAAPEAVLAAAVGQATGKLAPCLRQASQWRVTPVWLEILPRMVYPLLILIVMMLALFYQSIYVLPRFQRIFADFKMKLPALTEMFTEWANWLGEFWWQSIGVGLGIVTLAGLFLFNFWLCWYCPGVSYFYRRLVQARVLKMLGLLLEPAIPAPQALGLLADSGYFGGAVHRRLHRVRWGVEQGEPLGEQLRRVGLLPHYMLPLVQAAQQSNRLPWALTELADHQAQRTLRFAQRLIQSIFPVILLAVGVVVGLSAVSVFLCLVDLINSQL